MNGLGPSFKYNRDVIIDVLFASYLFLEVTVLAFLMIIFLSRYKFFSIKALRK